MKAVSILFFLQLFLTGCAYIQPAFNPIDHHYYVANTYNKALVVLLPGIGESSEAFVDNGVVKAITECRNDTNIVGVNAYFSYYRKQSVARRIHYDVIEPARQSGIEEIWFMGLSLGGLGTLIHRNSYPQDVSGSILVAPYIGEWEVLSAYLQGEEVDDKERVFAAVWQSIQHDASAISLAYGESDKYSKQHRWLAGYLPRQQVETVEGGHTWNVWKKLWPIILQQSGFCH